MEIVCIALYWWLIVIFDKITAVIHIIYMYLKIVSTSLFYRKALLLPPPPQKSTFKNWSNSCSHELAKGKRWRFRASWLNSFIDYKSVKLLLPLINFHFHFFPVRAPPQIRRPNREVRPLRKEMPGAGARGPVGRAHPISKSEKPSTSRDKDYRAKGREDKARLSL